MESIGWIARDTDYTFLVLALNKYRYFRYSGSLNFNL